MRLGCHPQSGALLGGVVQTYLLEKSRVISFSEQERNFHAFYQVLAAVGAHGADSDSGGGGSDAPPGAAAAASVAAGAAGAGAGRFASLELPKLGLCGRAAEYRLLSQGGVRDARARGIDDLESFGATISAMGDMAFTTEEARHSLLTHHSFTAHHVLTSHDSPTAYGLPLACRILLTTRLQARQLLYCVYVLYARRGSCWDSSLPSCTSPTSPSTRPPP